MTEHHRNSGITRSNNIDSETTVTGGSPRYSPAETSEVRRGGGFWNRFCLCCGCSCNRGCCCYQNEQTRPCWVHQCHAVTKSIVWRILYIFFSLFLLFGSPIQELTVDVRGDIVFSVVRNIMLAYFLSDMMVRCITDRDYFVCTVRGGSMNPTTLPSAPLSGSPGGGGGARHSMSYMDAKEMHSPCIIGSFLFWCDLISTLAILYDLQYINPNVNGVREVQIELDEDGIPVSDALVVELLGFILPCLTRSSCHD